MNYTAEEFKKDTAVVAYVNDPKEALNKLKKLHKKIKNVVESDYNYNLGKVYTEQKGKNYFVVFPVINKDVEEGDEVSDEMWNEVDKDVSFWMYQVVEDAKLDEVWSFEGQREADANTIEVMFYLK